MASCIQDAYGERGTSNLGLRASNLETPDKATQSHIKATPKPGERAGFFYAARQVAHVVPSGWKPPSPSGKDA